MAFWFCRANLLLLIPGGVRGIGRAGLHKLQRCMSGTMYAWRTARAGSFTRQRRSRRGSVTKSMIILIWCRTWDENFV